MSFWKIAAAALALLWPSGCAHPKATPGIQSEVLMKSTASWDGTPYTTYPRGRPELTVVKIKIPPHSVLNWHTHPIPNAAYMLAGELTVETRKPGQKRVIKQGDTLAETVGIIHRGVTGEQPAELIVFYAGVPMTPLTEIAK
ncbi:MAG: cupin domain-containing protein [Pseudomonas sp.]|uniref:cupin domain-containing protein n=1 Tax=Pseudomonas sp. TaxID=306 RepID=UPI0030F301CA